jgi:hypothetical protein
MQQLVPVQMECFCFVAEETPLARYDLLFSGVIKQSIPVNYSVHLVESSTLLCSRYLFLVQQN